MEYRVKQANKFLAKGEQVRVVLTYKGREVTHWEIGQQTLQSFVSQCDGVQQGTPRVIQGRRKQLQVTINPKKR